jgi:hypothetical protein
MAKLIQDVVHDADVKHAKYISWQQQGCTAPGVCQKVPQNSPAYNPNFELGDAVWGYNFNQKMVTGLLTKIDPNDETGLYYFIENQQTRENGWCEVVYLTMGVRSPVDQKRVDQMKARSEGGLGGKPDPEHWGSY